MKWYYEKDGEQQGPVDEAEVRRLLAAGEISSASKVWHKGLGDWQPAGEVLGVSEPPPAAPEPPAAKPPEASEPEPGPEAAPPDESAKLDAAPTRSKAQLANPLHVMKDDLTGKIEAVMGSVPGGASMDPKQILLGLGAVFGVLLLASVVMLAGSGSQDADSAVDRAETAVQAETSGGTSAAASTDGGKACKYEDDCESGNCTNGKCQSKEVGSPCRYEDDCDSKNCTNNACQATTAGSPCRYDDDCDSDNCVSDRCK